MKKKVISTIILFVIVFNFILPFVVYATDDVMYEDETEDISINNVSDIQGTNSLGNLIADEVSLERDKENLDGDYSIFSVEFNNTEATINYTAKEEAIIILGIYNEEGTKLIKIEQITVDNTRNRATIWVNEIPEYFYVKAFMVDKDMIPVANMYESPMYTREMQELMRMTTDEFSTDKVLNLDADKTTNFAIYDDNTTRIKYSNSVNILRTADEEKKVYIFDNINDQISSLKNGNKLSYEQNDGNILLINISQIKLDGNTATITGIEDCEMQDFFDYIKIEAKPTVQDYEAKALEDSGIQYRQISNTYDSAQVKKLANSDSKLEYKLNCTIDKEVGDKTKISASISAKFSVELNVYLTESNKYIEFNQSMTFEQNTKITGKVKLEMPLVQYLKIKALNIIEIDLTPKALFEASAAVTLNNVVKQEMSLTFNNGKFSLKSTPPNWGQRNEISTKVDAFVGLVFNPKIEVSKIVTLEYSNKMGLEFKSKGIKTNSEVIHECDKCICADINLLMEWNVSLKISLAEFSFDNEKKIKLSDFHYCLDDGSWGLYSCPKIKYRVIATVKQFDNKPVKDAGIEGTRLGRAPITNDEGVATFYLPNGNYTLKANAEAGEISKTIAIEDECINVEFITRDGYDENRNCYYGFLGDSDVRWSLYMDSGKLYIDGTGEMPYEYSPKYKRITPEENQSEFEEGNSIKEVIIGKNIEGISSRAFCGLKNLEKVIINSKRLKYIGNDAFAGSGNEKFKEIIIPDSVMEVGKGAFACSYLESVTIPKNLKILREGAFGSSKLKYFELPDKLLEIYEHALGGCNVEILEFPETLKIIGERCFVGSNLKKVIIPDSVEELGEYAFAECESLESVKISNKIKTIKEGTFRSADGNNLTEVIVPDSVTIIEKQAFFRCWNLEEIDIPNAEFIGSEAFGECFGLKKIRLPRKVGIMDDAFYCFSYDWNIDPEIEYIATSKKIKENSMLKLAKSNEVISDSSNVKTLEQEKTSVIEDLVPNEQYLVASLKNEFENDVLSQDNVLYLTQETADSNGRIEIKYIPKEDILEPNVVVFGIFNVKEVLLDEENIHLETQKEYQLIAKISPQKVVDSSIIWKSSNPNVVTVDDNGKLISLSEGNAIISATSSNGKVATCQVTVSNFEIGDVNGDGKVNFSDYAAILAHVKKIKLLY